MPRGGSGGRAGRSAPPRARKPPQPVYHPPPPAPVQTGDDRSFLGTVFDGLAFGTGAEVAHRAVGAVMGPRAVRHETVGSQPVAAAAPAPTENSLGGDACNVHSKSFQDCLNSNGSDVSKCQFYMDMLAECRRNSASAFAA
ncbi:uncharacterized protein LOC114743127 isoform X2 [Neltuma alba]|uniref:uncharacterized protein LOC114743127 isoform X2 n=1 Tax=Neltuma alba TaxID=207710 RepID=UPI0010A3191C|nr:uncharacterized protein LOC114743127 isoform X2 [Prosopis alba]